MVNFLLKEDIKEKTIKNTLSEFKVTNEEVYEFLDIVNQYYTDECLELQVEEEDILVYDPDVDVEDLRYGSLVKLCRMWFLEEILFAYYTNGEDKNAKYSKYNIALQKRMELMNKLSKNRIIGLKPAVKKTQNSFAVIKRFHGEY